MKRIIIVGASSGIGRQIAMQYISQCDCMVGVAARRVELLEELHALAPSRVFVEAIDVATDYAAGSLNSLIDKVGGMDLFILSSGVGNQNPQLDAGIERRTIDTNVKGFTTMIDAAYGYFRDNCLRGQVAAITSIAGTRGIGIAASYSASKRYQWCYLTAMEQLARTQHVDVSFTDIRPGFVRTPLLADGNDYPMMMSAEYVARAAVRAIERRRRVVIINGLYAIVVFFWRLIPRFLWRRMVLSTRCEKS